MSDQKLTIEDALLSSLDADLEGLIEHLESQEENNPELDRLYEEDYTSRKEKENELLEEVISLEVPSRKKLELTPNTLLESTDSKPQVITEDIVEPPPVERTNNVALMADKLSGYLSRINKDGQSQPVQTTAEQRFFKIEQRLEMMSRTILENTIVSGIGQGGDGQTPGSGEVRILNMDDVNARDITEGQTLIWSQNLGTFVPASIPGISSGVNSIIEGTGISINPPSGFGDVMISLDASIDDLVDVDLSGITDGQTLVWDSGSGTFEPADPPSATGGAVDSISVGDGLAMTPVTGVGDVDLSLDASIDDLNDVSIVGITPGQILVWDDTQNRFEPGDIPSNGVTSITVGDGLDIDPGTGIGDVTLTVDLALTDLRDIEGTAEDGDILVYDGTYNQWVAGAINTSQLTLTNPQGNNPFGITRVDLSGVYTTQEDANILFGELFEEYDIRINELENATKPGTFLGKIDCTNPTLEPDHADLVSGDYFIHDGIAADPYRDPYDTDISGGPLWGVGDTVEHDNQVIWNGSTWIIVSTVTTLTQLGDVNVDVALTGDFLQYDESDQKWHNTTVDIPKVTVSNLEPNVGNEKDGDIWYDDGEEILYIYQFDNWVEVSSKSGANVEVSSIAPAGAEEGDLWVDDDQYLLYVYHDNQWIGLTNDGLSGGGSGGDIHTHDIYVKKGTPGSLERMDGALHMIGGPEADGANLYITNNGFVRWGYGDINTQGEYGGYVFMRNDTTFELGTYTDVDFKIKAKTEIDGDLTVTSLANVGVGVVGADADGKLILLDENALPDVTLNHYEYLYRAFNPPRDEPVEDSEMIYYQINYDHDTDHSVTVTFEIDKENNGTWEDANTLKSSLGILNISSTQLVFYGPQHASYPAGDVVGTYPNLKIRAVITSGSGANQVTETFPELELFDGNPRRVEITATTLGDIDINDRVDWESFNYGLAQLSSGVVSTDASGFTWNASLIPDTNAQYDLGSAEYKVRHLFLSDNSIYTPSGKLSVGSIGSDGGDNVVSGKELKAIVAESTSWEDFQQRIANFDF